MHICFLDIDGTLVLTGGAGQTAFGARWPKTSALTRSIAPWHSPAAATGPSRWTFFAATA